VGEVIHSFDKNLLNFKHAMKNYIKVKKVSITRKDHLHFHTLAESLPYHQSLTRTYRKKHKWNIHNRLTFLELITITLTTILTEVLSVIQGKEFV
jgi:plasmid rolling circle replication initiator protein Rep